jgi:hypothetical protein
MMDIYPSHSVSKINWPELVAKGMYVKLKVVRNGRREVSERVKVRLT